MVRYGFFLFLLLLAPAGAAKSPIHLDAKSGTQVAMDYLRLDSSRLDAAKTSHSAGDIRGARSRFLGRYSSPEQTWSVALGHEYNALDITLAGAQPLTNGDLHALHVSGTWIRATEVGTLSLALAPAIAVSSNALKNPGELDGDSLQLWGSALWSHPYRSWEWIAGLVRDYRLGDEKIYPTAGAFWRSERVSLWATYPDLRLDWLLTDRWSLAITVHPDGGEWRTLNKTLNTRSAFRREAWQAELRLKHHWRNGLSLGLIMGCHWGQAWRFRLEDGQQLSIDGDSSSFLGIHFGWHP